MPIFRVALSTTEKIGDKRTHEAGDTRLYERQGFVKARDVAEAIYLKPSRTRDYLGELVKEGLITSEGSNRNRKYRLKK
ncbi:MAG: hypothetical protein IJH36_11335 [Clostridia bacterium]|nr:hypothetical protein [Clostridia bacterium]